MMMRRDGTPVLFAMIARIDDRYGSGKTDRAATYQDKRA
jgi:hypothetical protein